jgi:hypothetical protein
MRGDKLHAQMFGAGGTGCLRGAVCGQDQRDAENKQDAAHSR